MNNANSANNVNVSNVSNQYCTFTLGDLYFGVPVRYVQEVIRCQAMTRVPLASPVIRGLINLRGQIVTAVDLRRRLDLPDRAENVRSMNIIVRVDNEAISLLVDEIGDVTEVGPDTFEDVPDTISGKTREIVDGVHKLDGRLLLVLNTVKAIGPPSAVDGRRLPHDAAAA